MPERFSGRRLQLRNRIGFLTALMAMLGLSLVVLLAGFALAEEEGGCYFDGETYPEGYEMCQGGSMMRCEEGAWAPIGMCHSNDFDPVVP
jgi:hypothetical protein